MRRPEIGTGFNEFLMGPGSPDNKDSLTNKHISKSLLALTGNKCTSICFGVILSMLDLGIFKFFSQQHSELFEDRVNLYFAIYKTMHLRNIFVSEVTKILLPLSQPKGNMRNNR